MNRDSVIRSTLNTHKWCEEIKHDLFDITGRLRDIDDGYFVLRNKKSHKFEVHHVENYPTTYSFLVPFDFLDARTLEYCMKTRRENIDRLLKEASENNEKLKKSAKNKVNDRIEDIAIETAKDLRRAI